MKDITNKFKAVDPSAHGSIYNDSFRDMERALWILTVSKRDLDMDYMNGEVISEILTEVFEIKSKALSIKRALASCGDKINVKKEGKNILYKIMKKGEEHLGRYSPSENITLVYIEQDKPRTAKKSFSNIIKQYNGEIMICDPYYGVKLLDIIESFSKGAKIKILSSKSNEEKKFLRAYQDFIKENHNVEFRLYPHPEHLHDRYILTKDTLFFIGHSIKDLGNKESFIVALNKTSCQDTLRSLLELFSRRWKISKPIIN